MEKALFLNGVYAEVLEEIVNAQRCNDGVVCFLQPYSEKVIKLLEENDFSKTPSLPCYMSTTTDMNHIVYVAQVVGWKNKRELANNTNLLDALNKRVAEYQPSEQGVYLYADDEKKKECVNLIEISHLRRLNVPWFIGNLKKVSDNKACKPRMRPGGWSYVYAVPPDILEASESFMEQIYKDELDREVKQSGRDSHEARRRRLEKANRKPDPIQIISKGYRRNPDVIAAVLERANGVCECCGSPAPFLRKSDHTPYLEVHHKVTLADGGDDTVENAEALCPNCHREKHFGK